MHRPAVMTARTRSRQVGTAPTPPHATHNRTIRQITGRGRRGSAEAHRTPAAARDLDGAPSRAAHLLVSPRGEHDRPYRLAVVHPRPTGGVRSSGLRYCSRSSVRQPTSGDAASSTDMAARCSGLRQGCASKVSRVAGALSGPSWWRWRSVVGPFGNGRPGLVGELDLASDSESVVAVDQDVGAANVDHRSSASGSPARP